MSIEKEFLAYECRYENGLDDVTVGQQRREDEEVKPVRTPDGEIECFTITIKGKFFYCECGCNCFHKPDDTRLNYYACNSCKTTYEETSKGE